MLSLPLPPFIVQVKLVQLWMRSLPSRPSIQILSMSRGPVVYCEIATPVLRSAIVTRKENKVLVTLSTVMTSALFVPVTTRFVGGGNNGDEPPSVVGTSRDSRHSSCGFTEQGREEARHVCFEVHHIRHLPEG